MRKQGARWALVLGAMLAAVLLAGCASDPEVVFEDSYDFAGGNNTGGAATYSFTLYDDGSASVTGMGMTINMYTWSQQEGDLTNGTVVVSISSSAGGTSMGASYTLTIENGEIKSATSHTTIG